MRRKSERSTANKKAKASPEKKVEKTKRTRTRRRKQSTSSDNESADEVAPVVEVESVDSNSEVKVLPLKETVVEETQDQVWQVKTAEVTVGEIQKLKICLTRPPSTPEMVDSSPLSKRKHSRTTSSSDTPSTEGGDERKKKKHSKRSNREPRDEQDKSQDSQDELDVENKKLTLVLGTSDTQDIAITDDSQVTESGESKPQDQSQPSSDKEVELNQVLDSTTKDTEKECKIAADRTDADSTVVSPQKSNQHDLVTDTSDFSARFYNKSDKNEVLNKEDIEKQNDNIEKQEEESREVSNNQGNVESLEEEVSSVDKTENRLFEEANIREDIKASETNVVDSSQSEEKGPRKTSNETVMEKEEYKNEVGRELERSDSVQSTQEESLSNGAGPIVINRKRRWGSRPSKITMHKSITISTDILKEIIPDVKPVELEEVIEEKKQHRRVEVTEKVDRPVLPKIVIDNTDHVEHKRECDDSKEKENLQSREVHLGVNRKISIVKENDSIITRPPSPPRHKPSCILYITNLVRPFTLPQLKNLLQRTGRLVEDGFWIDRIKSKCFVKYETEDQAVETRHALHGVTWPVSNPKSLQVDFSTQEAFDKAKLNEDQDNAQASTIPGTVEDWLREQDLKRERGDLEKPWERKTIVREWDVGKNGKEKEKEKFKREEHPMEKRRHRTPERSPEPARKFKKKEEEAPAKLLDDLFRKTKSVPCIYWLPLSAETIAVKEEQRRKHMAEHERRMQELRRTHRRH